MISIIRRQTSLRLASKIFPGQIGPQSEILSPKKKQVKNRWLFLFYLSKFGS
jgi:hypothetical protein